MTGPSPTQKLHANLEYLRERGASPERIHQEIAKFKASQDQISANERKLSGIEKVAAVGSELGSGATFGLLDEAVGLFDKDAKNEQRFLQHQLAEENPKTAFAANVAGSFATPGSFFKAAPKAAGIGRKVFSVLREGAAQGAAAGVGNNEGGLGERVQAGLKGAGWGTVAAGALGGAGKVISGSVRKGAEALGLTAPSLEELVSKIANEDIAKARLKLEQFKQRRLDTEATVADVLPQGEGALRASATANREVRKRVDQDLRQRSNRLANLAEERFSEHTGTLSESADKTVAGMNSDAAQRARPLYDAAKNEAAAAPHVDRIPASRRAEMEAMGIPPSKIPTADAVDDALALPYVQQRIGQLKSAPRSRFAKLPDDHHELLDQVYKDIGKQIRSLDRKDWALKDDLIQQRGVLADAITSRAPTYKDALNTFAGDMSHRDAYLMGHQHAPSDVIPDEIASLDAATVPNYKQGKAQALRRDVPNLDVGEHARFQDVLAPIATKEKAAVFRATFGDKAYREYVRDLLGMAELQKMKGGAGESTTIDKMMEQLQAGGDPHQIAMAVADLVRGNPARAIARAAPLKVLDNLRHSRVAKTNADFLLRRGEPDVTRSLDEIVTMRDAAQRSSGRSYRGQPGRRVVNAAARIVGSSQGRP